MIATLFLSSMQRKGAYNNVIRQDEKLMGSEKEKGVRRLMRRVIIIGYCISVDISEGRDV